MKVAIVVPYVYDGGGVPAVASYLCQILSCYDCQVISVSTSKRDIYSVRLFQPRTWFHGIKMEKGEWEGKSVLNVGAFLTEVEVLRYMPRQKLTRLLNKFDVVQVVAGAPAWAYLTKDVEVPVLLQVATLVREERKRLIATSHGIKKLYLQLSTSLVGILERRALHRVSRVFVENHWMYQHLTELLGSDRVVMAPPGVDADFYIPKESRIKCSDFSARYFISVGRFNDRRKNVRLLFDALHRLRKLDVSLPLLLLVGLTEPTNDDWHYAETLGVRESVVFKKNVSRPELVTLLQDAEAFVCSSDEEGLGIAMLEAMACATPVISTRCGGPETFIRDGENGYLVERNSPDELARRMSMFLSDEKQRRSFGDAARKTVEAGFSSQVTRDTFLHHYHRLDLRKAGL